MSAYDPGVVARARPGFYGAQADPLVPAGHRIVTALVYEGAVFFDRSFTDPAAAIAALAAQAADPGDPNVLPDLWIDLSAAEPRLEVIGYNPVGGIVIGDESFPLDAPAAEIAEAL